MCSRVHDHVDQRWCGLPLVLGASFPGYDSYSNCHSVSNVENTSWHPYQIGNDISIR